jgi:TetR/AcrR family transcriptional regulator, transcriptional repressor for nem operon
LAGLRQFDTDAVLDKAMRVFWDLGYNATSMTDLEAATGLGRSSIYGAFHDKESLFLTVLDRYIENSRLPFFEAMKLADFSDSIRAALQGFVNTLLHEDAKPGCLLVLAACNSEGNSLKIRRRVVAAIAAEEQAFFGRLEKGQSDGQIRQNIELRAVARFLSAQTRSLGLTARMSADPAHLNDLVSGTMAYVETLRLR